jgi:hypothetical protein
MFLGATSGCRRAAVFSSIGRGDGAACKETGSNPARQKTENLDSKRVTASSSRSAPRPAERAPGTITFQVSIEDTDTVRWNEGSKYNQASISLEKGAPESINSSHFSCLFPAFFL